MTMEPPGVVTSWMRARLPAPLSNEGPTLVLHDGRDILMAASLGSIGNGGLELTLAAERGVLWATQSVLDCIKAFAFWVLDARRFTAMIAAGNIPSRRLARAFGMREIGTLPDWYPDGQPGVLYDLHGDDAWSS